MKFLETFDYTSLLPIVKSIGERKVVEPTFDDLSFMLVLSKHRHYRHLVVEIYEAQYAKSGRLKNPLRLIDPLALIWKSENTEEIKFYSAVSKFKNHYTENNTDADLEALKAIVLNPNKLPVFIHDEDLGASVNANTLVNIELSLLSPQLEITVDERNASYAIAAHLQLNGKRIDIALALVKFQYFVAVDDELHLIQNPRLLSLIDFFRRHRNQLVFDQEAYDDFEEQVLQKLEEKIKVNYSYLRPATAKQIEEKGFDLVNEKIIYLSESEDFVLITPVMKYGGLEIPIISQKQIKSKDKKGKSFTLHRDEERELQFLADVVRAHPYFKTQLAQFAEQLHADCFYLHRKHFLEPKWFLEVFEVWRNKGVVILGFNALKDNKQSAFKAEIDIKVNSGMDWFETAIRLQFNKQTISLKHLHKSLRSKHKFVSLDDGTYGVLPEEWLRRFEAYFAVAEIEDEVLRTPNISYETVQELYDETFFADETKLQLQSLSSKLHDFKSIEEVEIPKTLNATLRDYQKEGVNWLNFLDQFNFGGCLADDMGLGKTLQIITFILTQKEKGIAVPNLIVVPASLVFNWQHEMAKFAPTLKTTIIYGSTRQKEATTFDGFDVVLTSYGTMLADISWLKNYRFNYIFLDESQAIKNPDSQRYKAAKMLTARNRIVITGTPIENSTFDLYGQLSFACSGLLGNREHFKLTYAIPIDQFKLTQRANELQQRIKPFVLRRTKEQVAKELPPKNEMIIYCEMGARQREIYDSYRKEIRDYLIGASEDELKKSSMHVLQGITKLRQICNAPLLISREDYYKDSSAKLDVLLAQIENKAPQHKILVFSQFVGMLDLVSTALTQRDIKFSYLTGQTRNREAAINTFVENDDVRVFLISLKAGGVGLNLTQADYVYLIDPWWNPAVENQAIDRAHRIGQDKNVIAVRLICPDTIEEKMMLMQQAKKNLASELIKTDDTMVKLLNKQDLLNLL